MPLALSLSNSNIHFTVAVVYTLPFNDDPEYAGGHRDNPFGDLDVDIESNIRNTDATFFPWPPPQASAEVLLNNTYFKTATTLYQVKAILDTVLSHCGYEDKSYYLIPNGFAVITRIEQIKSDGYPLSAPNRWDIETNQDYLSFLEKIEAKFVLRPGYFRVFAFIITNKPFINDSKISSKQIATEWKAKGTIHYLIQSAT